VPHLKEGAGVVTSRADVHYVVTEFGVANLFGRNLRERALALIEIADPRFQDELERAAKERKLL
jgi:acyl-CoA hydrolase